MAEAKILTGYFSSALEKGRRSGRKRKERYLCLPWSSSEVSFSVMNSQYLAKAVLCIYQDVLGSS